MNRLAVRISGALLILAAVLGWVVSLAGLGLVWRLKQPVTENLVSSTQLLHQSMQTTGRLLVITDAALGLVEENLVITRSSLENAAAAMRTTAKFSNATAGLVGDELVDVVTETQAALDSVEKSARLVDDTLRIVTLLPLARTRYAPEQPLQKSILEVSASLEKIPPSLGEMQEGLMETSKDLLTIQADLEKLAGSLNETGEKMAEAKQVMSEYRRMVNDAGNQLVHLEQALPGVIRAIAWAATGLFIWLLISQIGLLIQGIHLLKQHEEKP